MIETLLNKLTEMQEIFSNAKNDNEYDWKV